LLPTLAFAVAPSAYRRGANVALDLLSGLLTPRMAHVHQLAMHAALLILLMVGLDLTLRKVGVDPAPLSAAINAMTGLDLSAIRPFRAPIKIPMLNIEWRSVYMVMPASVALMILANIELLLRHLLGVLDPAAHAARRVRSFEDVTSAAGE
jgi:TRAP-type C4-dicarboxylate transport system permease small subunit